LQKWGNDSKYLRKNLTSNETNLGQEVYACLLPVFSNELNDGTVWLAETVVPGIRRQGRINSGMKFIAIKSHSARDENARIQRLVLSRIRYTGE
jgi:hypothetical protein